MAKVLVVDDELLVINVLSKVLETDNHDVTVMQDGNAALELVRSGQFDLLICDLKMSPVDGMQILTAAHDSHPEMPVLMVTGYATVSTAVEALKLGAFDYVCKPFKIDELLGTVSRALDYGQVMAGKSSAVELSDQHYGLPGIVAVNAEMRSLCETIKRVAPTDAPILLLGDNGVGKATIAKAIHDISPRNDKSFQRINCGSITEAEFEARMIGNGSAEGFLKAAQSGTLLLEELESMPHAIQNRLESLMEDKIIESQSGEREAMNIRFMVSAGPNPELLLQSGAISGGLFYRLKGIQITIPPLTRRSEDILPLAMHLLKSTLGQDAKIPDITSDVRAILQKYPWPGNVTELETVINYAIKSMGDSGEMTRDALPPDIANSVKPGSIDAESEFHKGEKLKEFLQRKLSK